MDANFIVLFIGVTTEVEYIIPMSCSKSKQSIFGWHKCILLLSLNTSRQRNMLDLQNFNFESLIKKICYKSNSSYIDRLSIFVGMYI